jgi:hypothetical protein
VPRPGSGAAAHGPGCQADLASAVLLRTFRTPGALTSATLADSVVSNLDAVLLSPGDDQLLAPIGPSQLSIAGKLAHLRDAEGLSDLIDE